MKKRILGILVAVVTMVTSLGIAVPASAEDMTVKVYAQDSIYPITFDADNKATQALPTNTFYAVVDVQGADYTMQVQDESPEDNADLPAHYKQDYKGVTISSAESYKWGTFTKAVTVTDDVVPIKNGKTNVLITIGETVYTLTLTSVQPMVTNITPGDTEDSVAMAYSPIFVGGAAMNEDGRTLVNNPANAKYDVTVKSFDDTLVGASLMMSWGYATASQLAAGKPYYTFVADTDGTAVLMANQTTLDATCTNANKWVTSPTITAQSQGTRLGGVLWSGAYYNAYWERSFTKGETVEVPWTPAASGDGSKQIVAIKWDGVDIDAQKIARDKIQMEASVNLIDATTATLGTDTNHPTVGTVAIKAGDTYKLNKVLLMNGEESKNNSNKTTLGFNTTYEGNYTVWFKYYNHGDGYIARSFDSDNTVNHGYDAQTKLSSSLESDFQWHFFMSGNLAAGAHTINIESHRAFVYIDKILVAPTALVPDIAAVEAYEAAITSDDVASYALEGYDDVMVDADITSLPMYLKDTAKEVNGTLAPYADDYKNHNNAGEARYNNLLAAVQSDPKAGDTTVKINASTAIADPLIMVACFDNAGKFVGLSKAVGDTDLKAGTNTITVETLPSADTYKVLVWNAYYGHLAKIPTPTVSTPTE